MMRRELPCEIMNFKCDKRALTACFYSHQVGERESAGKKREIEDEFAKI